MHHVAAQAFPNPQSLLLKGHRIRVLPNHMNSTTTFITSTAENMAGKPVLYRDAKTVLTLTSEEFQEKGLCDGITLNLGDSCVFSCCYCYAGPAMTKVDKSVIEGFNTANGFSLESGTAKRITDLVIRRRHSIALLRSQLLTPEGRARYLDPTDRRVVYSSTLVDVAANMEMLRETAEAVNLILEHTHWSVRLLSKSPLLARLIQLIPERHWPRLIFGFSTGTLDDGIARAIEVGTGLVSKRIAALHSLQDQGLRTFAMICPSLPQEDYVKFSREICDAVRVDRCEHVWAEPLNVRGKSLLTTSAALCAAGYRDEAKRLGEASRDRVSMDHYARQTFEAHTRHVAPSKLRFLQYVDPAHAEWWMAQRDRGAFLLGKHAKEQGLVTIVPSAAPNPFGAVPVSSRPAHPLLTPEAAVTAAGSI